MHLNMSFWHQQNPLDVHQGGIVFYSNGLLYLAIKKYPRNRARIKGKNEKMLTCGSMVKAPFISLVIMYILDDILFSTVCQEVGGSFCLNESPYGRTRVTWLFQGDMAFSVSRS